MKKLLLIIFFLQLSPSFPKTTKFDSTVTAGIKQIYNIKFSEAERTFHTIISKYPNKPQGKFFLAMIDWWRIMLDPDNKSYDHIFFQKLEKVIKQCDNILKKNPNNVDALFFKGGAIGFKGRLYAYRNSWFNAANDGRLALPIVEKAAKLDPSNVDVQLGFGIYDYYAAVIPDKYPLIKPLMIFLPPGNKQKGLKELTYVAAKGKYAKYESRYFLMTLYYNYENNPFKADKYAKMLSKEFPDNPVFERWKGRIAAKMGNYSKAAKIFKDILNKAKQNYIGYDIPNVKREASYYVGLNYRNYNQLDSAKYYFNMCAALSKKIDRKEPSGFLINSYLYLGIINDLQGNRKKALAYYNKLLDMRNYGQSHSSAKQYILKPYK